MDMPADPATLADEQILLGDEAVARGAIDAGISAAYAYPGTPSTEIFQTIQDQARALGCPCAACGPPTRRWRWKKAWACPTPASAPSCR
jgi:hypothetical protein